MSERISCPRCGGVRLVRRNAVLSEPSLGHGLPFGLYIRRLLSRRKWRLVVYRQQYLCELCGHRWDIDRLEEQKG